MRCTMDDRPRASQKLNMHNSASSIVHLTSRQFFLRHLGSKAPGQTLIVLASVTIEAPSKKKTVKRLLLQTPHQYRRTAVYIRQTASTARPWHFRLFCTAPFNSGCTVALNK